MLYIFLFITALSGMMLLAGFLFRSWEIRQGRLQISTHTADPLFTFDSRRVEKFFAGVWDKSAHLIRGGLIVVFTMLTKGVQALSRLLLRVSFVRRVYHLITGKNEYSEAKRNGASLYLKHITSHRDIVREQAKKKAKNKKGNSA